MDVLRVGVVGTGMIGRTHIERINNKLSGARVVACADVNAEFCKKVADQYGIKAFEDGESMIASPEVDAVIVTTIDQVHERFVTSAIRAGKYVFCEKPLAPTAEDCKRIMEEEIKAGKKLVQVGFMRRYDHGYRQLKEAVETRKYGEPLLLHCRHRNPDVDANWNESSAVENSMVHEMDVLRWLLGENYKTAEVRFGKVSKRASGFHDPQILILTTESGVRIDVESYVTNANCYDVQCEVVCEDAILNLPQPANIEVLSGAFRGRAVDSTWATRFVDAYNVEFQEWINACKEGRVDGPTAWDGYACQVVASAASKARDTQEVQPVVYDEKPELYR
ncbi:MAG: Gfo/Idh/MocA family oxidoreductase [Eubacterium sp.]|nr:Gfo/Idh/MocA family oxidoreductase [Eubacterium sp.]